MFFLDHQKKPSIFSVNFVYIFSPHNFTHFLIASFYCPVNCFYANSRFEFPVVYVEKRRLRRAICFFVYFMKQTAERGTVSRTRWKPPLRRGGSKGVLLGFQIVSQFAPKVVTCPEYPIFLTMTAWKIITSIYGPWRSGVMVHVVWGIQQPSSLETRESGFYLSNVYDITLNLCFEEELFSQQNWQFFDVFAVGRFDGILSWYWIFIPSNVSFFIFDSCQSKLWIWPFFLNEKST